MKKLARDIRDFPTMIREGYLYIDKTKQMLDLFNNGDRYFFLSRPRRFGKSLLLSTLKSFFLRERDLFKDLWVGKQEDIDWQEHPVIHIDFSLLSFRDPEKLEQSLNYRLDKEARSHGVDISFAYDPKTKLELLVEGLSKKNTVVVLIDEYDKPILDHIHDPVKAEAQREVLKEFYDGFKGLDGFLRCIFITGVSKFSKTSIFSGLNNLVELSYEPEAADLLGYTEEEVEHYFKEYLVAYASENKKTYDDVLTKVRHWYNGYRFSEKPVKVYNPFSLTYFCRTKKFSNYWFQSGTPSFLVELLKDKPLRLREVGTRMLTLSALGTFRITDIPLETLFFQTGYFTITDYNEKHDAYQLGYPNEEVKQSLSILELGVLTNAKPVDISNDLIRLRDSLDNEDIETFAVIVRSLIAGIPFQLHIDREAYYHSLFQLLCNLLGFENHCEVSTSKGRIDLIIETDKHVYIFEFKFNETATQALKQIHERKYYERYLASAKKIVLVGFSFSSDDKLLEVQWEKESINK